MASGNEHDRMILASAPALVVALATVSRPDLIPWVMGGYFFGGYLLSPDLDVNGANNCLKRWQIAGLGWYWWPYRVLFKHRGISHWPVAGSLTRVAWLVIPPLYIRVLLAPMPMDYLLALWNAWPLWWQPAAAILAGVEASAIIHLFGDSAFYRRFSRKKRRR